MRTEIREAPGCTIWQVTDEAGSVHFEVKCGVHRIVRFGTEAEAHAHFDRWALEVAHDIDTFDR